MSTFSSGSGANIISIWLLLCLWSFGSETIVSSVLTRYNPTNNQWSELGSFGKARQGHRVINSEYGIVIVGGKIENEDREPSLCQVNYTSVECVEMESHRPFLPFRNEIMSDIILFVFDSLKCPERIKGKSSCFVTGIVLSA